MMRVKPSSLAVPGADVEFIVIRAVSDHRHVCDLLDAQAVAT
jgi:hypothetical protein